jgi:hypothetical protein
LGKVKTVVFGEATKKRRPRTSWMAKPLVSPAEPTKIPRAPAAPGFADRKELPSSLPEALLNDRADREVSPTRTSFPPSSLENPDKHPPPVIIDPGPSPMEIARGKALDEREGLLERSIEEIAALRKTIMSETEQQLVELAAAIARRVIGRELALNPDILLGLAAEGLDALAEGDRVKVRVGTMYGDATIAAFRARVKARAAHVEVDYDEKLGPGACVVETELGRVDESVELRLTSVLAHLFGQAENGDFSRKAR